MSDELYSYHIFLFPFKWEVFQGKKHEQLPLSSRTSITAIKQHIEHTCCWDDFKFKPEIKGNFNTYNEYAYFYDYARDVLNLDDQQNHVNFHQFKYNGITKDTSKYIIATDKNTYQLAIEQITLNIYDNGIGILSFHLANNTYKNFDDILCINDYGRRIYPQYLGAIDGELTQNTKGSFLAQYIALQNVVGDTTVKENFSHYDRLQQVQNQPFVLPKHISCLLGNRFIGHYDSKLKDDVIIQPILDDRMFVISCVFNQDLFEKMTVFCKDEKRYSYLNNDDWYKYVFVDTGTPSCHSSIMKTAQLTVATYDRWLDYRYQQKKAGHLFGISRYSFVMLGSDTWYPKNIVIKHLQHHYFQMVVLCLLQRAALINFSGEVARISERLSNDFNKLDKERKHISKLYLSYIKFVNRIYFREISPQEQGIELYDKLQEQMRTRKDVEDLGREIAELNTFAETVQQSQLTLIAGKFLPPSLVAGILGINAETYKPIENFWFGIGIILLTFFLSDYVIRIFQKK